MIGRRAAGMVSYAAKGLERRVLLAAIVEESPTDNWTPAPAVESAEPSAEDIARDDAAALRRGNDGNDTATTTTGASADGNDVIKGGTGIDVLTGNFGDDDIDGEGDNDYIYGDDSTGSYLCVGYDTLQGGAGVDRLWGGYGEDLLEGGAGADYFYGADQRGRESLIGSDQRGRRIKRVGSL